MSNRERCGARCKYCGRSTNVETQDCECLVPAELDSADLPLDAPRVEFFISDQTYRDLALRRVTWNEATIAGLVQMRMDPDVYDLGPHLAMNEFHV